MLPQSTKAAALIFRLGGKITAREYGRRSWMFRVCPRAMLQSMVEHGYGRWETRPSGPKGGRPSLAFVLGDDIDETGKRIDKTDGGETACASPEVLS